MYYNGDKSRSIPVDKAKAAEWYEKAADQRSISAQYKLGMMYYSGDGVPENKAKAAELFIKAADKGHPDAKEMLRRFSEQFKIWIY